ncbi:glycosyltransferase [Noviherbaspirillum denitrificans]|nr:glycosyltransferase [Noviherbaspirillum denitrificans]
MIDIAAFAALASFIASLLIIFTQNWHGKHSLDLTIGGIQKIHNQPVPRVGGIALLVGIASVVTAQAIDDGFAVQLDTFELSKLLLASTPAFLTGLVEDLTKKVSVKARLMATLASALLAAWLLDASLSRLDLWGVDAILQLIPLLAVAVTAVAVAGVANSINIIDGFHGVAGSAVVIMLAGLAYLSWQSNDVFVMHLAMLGIGAALGFLLVNYPTGRLFMGDGGAYFLGFWLAEVAVLLVIRNPKVNAWQVLAVCAYPVIEVLYSMYRRKVIRRTSPGAPDRLHLHTLFYRRVVCLRLARNDQRPWARNAVVACFMSGWIASTTLVTVLIGDTVGNAVGVLVAHVLIYIAVYTRLVRGRWDPNPAIALGFFRSQSVAREWQ